MQEGIAGAQGALRRVVRDEGTKIYASFRVERIGDAVTVVFESRGGTKASDGERNVDYGEGLEIVLRRLGGAGMQIADAVVESRDTATLPIEKRRLGGVEYPVGIADAGEVRKWMSAAQAKVGRQAGAKGAGNRTRRVRLRVVAVDRAVEEGEVGDLLEPVRRFP